MTEAQNKKSKYKYTPSIALSQKEYKRRQRIKSKKCSVCGKQAHAKLLLSQELRCWVHMVSPVKEGIIKQSEANKKSQQPAPSVNNQAIEAGAQAAANSDGE
ncbi:MAG: hypothetical protein WC325_13295 [Candidatus Bathyarchaeia archaeon]|jgi:hypothetical protein